MACRHRLHHGELEGENPNPLYQGDRAELALRSAEPEALIEDFKQLGVQDAKGTRWPWRGLSEVQKRFEIAFEIDELKLNSEASAYLVLGREVDLARILEGAQREIEAARAAAWPRPAGETNAFDHVVAELAPAVARGRARRRRGDLGRSVRPGEDRLPVRIRRQAKRPLLAVHRGRGPHTGTGAGAGIHEGRIARIGVPVPLGRRGLLRGRGCRFD